MKYSRRQGDVRESVGSVPSETWLFAQAISGKPLPDPGAAARRVREEREQLEWLAQISPRHAAELRKLESAEADARRSRDSLIWAAGISGEAQEELRRVLREEAAGQAAQQRWEQIYEASTLDEAWDPSKHPRLGGRPNAGWWATTQGSGGGDAATNSSPRIQTAEYRPNQSHTPIVTVGSQGQKQTSSRPSGGAPTTKIHLPADRRGEWVKGTKGHGTFRYNHSPENQNAGLAGKDIRFENQHIAVGGFPAESYYGGNANKASVTIERITGTKADGRAADAAMRRILGNPKWQRPEGYRWNHAGEPGSHTMELVRDHAHTGVAHKGPGAGPRANMRAARARGTTGRAMGALTVYLTARDALQAMDVLQPDYEVSGRETYHFRAEDGSVFVVHPGSFFASAKREYLQGPRKGQTEKITDEEVQQHRKQAEAEFGRYIPGSLLKQPRFIPGRQRQSLPLIIYKDGIPHEAGWIDEKGVHQYPVLGRGWL